MQTIGWCLDSPRLIRLGVQTATSPLPILLSRPEPFASDIEVTLLRSDGTRVTHQLEVGLFDDLEGPEVRRNAYASALLYGPAMTEARDRLRVAQVLHFGFCARGPLSRLLQERYAAQRVSVSVTPTGEGAGRAATMDVACSD
jgi:hypothetical protein